MPQIEFTLPRGALADDAIDALMEAMTASLLRHEGAPDNRTAREISWGFVHELDPARLYNAGAPIAAGGAAPRYRVDLTVPHGALTPAKKSSIVGEITRLIVAADAHGDAAAAMRVWVLVHEVADGNWGAAGRTWTLREIGQFATSDAAAVPA